MTMPTYDSAVLYFALAPILFGVTIGALRGVTWRYRKVGGIRFIRVARLQLSLCVVKTVTV
jgi:hypothetical protein